MIFRNRQHAIEIPNQPLAAYVLEHASGRGDKSAILDGTSGHGLSYAQLAASVARVAKGFALRGLKKGDVVAIYSPNLPEYAPAFLGVATLGGICTTASPLYTSEELARQLRDAGARFLVTVPGFLDKAVEAAAQASVEEIFVFGECDGASPFQSLLDNDGDAPEVAIDLEDLVALPYSSGTTGVQKGVMLTHRNLVANLVQTEQALEGALDANDTVLGVLPFFHIYGLVVVMNLSLRVGASIVTMPRFDFAECLALMERRRVTVAYLVPPIVLGLSKHPRVEDHDFSSLRWILSGAAPLGKDVTEACVKRLDCALIQGYGLTETSPVSHCGEMRNGTMRAGSVGPCVPGTECKIVDVETGEELGPDERGEIWIRGPQVMKGYLGRPDATKQCIDEDGFFHSGDIGYTDEDGHFFIVDRLKELIKYKGMQVAPAELEAVLLTHPSVSDAAVIPKADEDAGEIPKAFVVLGDAIDPNEILEFVASRVAPHKKVRAIEVVDVIPKSPSGKILRRVLVERERAETSSVERPKSAEPAS